MYEQNPGSSTRITRTQGKFSDNIVIESFEGGKIIKSPFPRAPVSMECVIKFMTIALRTVLNATPLLCVTLSAWVIRGIGLFFIIIFYT